MPLVVSVNTPALVWPARVGKPRNIVIHAGWGTIVGNGLSCLLVQIVSGFAFAFVARIHHGLGVRTNYAYLSNASALNYVSGICISNWLAISGIVIRLYIMELP